MRLLTTSGNVWQQLCARQLNRKRRVEDRVRQIIDDVYKDGDESLLRYTRRFDGVKLAPKQLRVNEAEISGSFQNLDPKFALHLKSIVFSPKIICVFPHFAVGYC